MIKGFLLIDASKNSVIIPWDDDELKDMLLRRGIIESIHKHTTLKELHTDISKYLKGTYKQKEEL